MRRRPRARSPKALIRSKTRGSIVVVSINPDLRIQCFRAIGKDGEGRLHALGALTRPYWGALLHGAPLDAPRAPPTPTRDFLGTQRYDCATGAPTRVRVSDRRNLGRLPRKLPRTRRLPHRSPGPFDGSSHVATYEASWIGSNATTTRPPAWPRELRNTSSNFLTRVLRLAARKGRSRDQPEAETSLKQRLSRPARARGILRRPPAPERVENGLELQDVLVLVSCRGI